MPDPPDLAKTPKQFIVNTCAVVIGEPFKAWVRQQVEDRNFAMKEKREMTIGMDPLIAAKFKASTHVSRKYLFLVIFLTVVFESPSFCAPLLFEFPNVLPHPCSISQHGSGVTPPTISFV